MDAEVAVSSDSPKHPDDAECRPAKRAAVEHREEANISTQRRDERAADTKPTGEKKEKESSCCESDDGSKKRPQEGEANDVADAGTAERNVSEDPCHGKVSEDASKCASPANDASDDGARPLESSKHGNNNDVNDDDNNDSNDNNDNSPPVGGRSLPARNSRVAAALQNQFVFECERLGWRVAASASGSSGNTPSKAGGLKPSRQRVRRASSSRLTGHSETAADRRFKQQKEQPASRKRNGAPDDPKGAAKAANVARHRGGKNLKGSSKAESRANSPPQAREPPPTDSGRPRRHAADRAAAAILAAATTTGRGYLVLDIPSVGLTNTATQKFTSRKAARRASSETESSEDSNGGPKGEAKEKSPKGSAGGRSDAEQRYEAISTDLDSKEDTKIGESVEPNGRRKSEAAASTHPECAREAGESDAKGDVGFMEVAVELETP